MLRNLHLTTAYGGASPQGEAFDKLHLNLMCRNMLKVVRGDDRNVNQKQNFEIFNYKKEIMKFRKGEKR